MTGRWVLHGSGYGSFASRLLTPAECRLSVWNAVLIASVKHIHIEWSRRGSRDINHLDILCPFDITWDANGKRDYGGEGSGLQSCFHQL
jgi:hypothetical protein